MNDEPPIIEYEAKPLRQRRWGLSRPVWLLVAGFCAFVEFSRGFATNGRINGRGDILFIYLFAVVGLIALIHGLPPFRRAGNKKANLWK